MAFWKWWTCFVSIIVSTLIIQYFVPLHYFLIELDQTKLSILILSIFVLINLAIGYFSYQLQFKKKKTSDKAISQFWFFSESLLSIGMVGTLLGFLMVLTTTFGNIDTTSTEEMKNVIATLASGMGVALITSLTGLISSICLKYQILILEQDNAEPI